MLRDLFSTNPDWTLTIIRIILGVVFFAHGAQKLLGWFGGPGLKETMRTMHDFLGLPLPLAFAAVATEFLGGVGLIVGLLSRVAAVGIGVTMLSAIVMVHGRNGLFMDWFAPGKTTVMNIISWLSRWPLCWSRRAPVRRRWITYCLTRIRRLEQATFDVGLATHYLVIQYQNVTGTGAIPGSRREGTVREGEACS